MRKRACSRRPNSPCSWNGGFIYCSRSLLERGGRRLRSSSCPCLCKYARRAPSPFPSGLHSAYIPIHVPCYNPRKNGVPVPRTSCFPFPARSTTNAFFTPLPCVSLSSHTHETVGKRSLKSTTTTTTKRWRCPRRSVAGGVNVPSSAGLLEEFHVSKDDAAVLLRYYRAPDIRMYEDAMTARWHWPSGAGSGCEVESS